MKKITATKNKWETLFGEFLSLCRVGIEKNPDSTKENTSYLLVRENEGDCGKPVVFDAEDVFTWLDSDIYHRIVTDLQDEALDYGANLPSYMVVSFKSIEENGTPIKMKMGKDAPFYWAAIRAGKSWYKDPITRLFIDDHDWEMKVCQMVSHEAHRISLEKFI